VPWDALEHWYDEDEEVFVHAVTRSSVSTPFGARTYVSSVAAGYWPGRTHRSCYSRPACVEVRPMSSAVTRASAPSAHVHPSGGCYLTGH
jgi:hypothetical protein